ncbi:TetR/AcrR family transcriptional regulator [Loktanella sp. D2R18]|uniref:TetR family transcriptional regulator C-terminal domain-containing protein n=1 Tax=Rhodobacterales TaxID=204455 RepID=UPI000DEB516D|nr:MULTISPECIES: TetR family transcriptional regulator C-terminal domain-containing protein [Rhodobacterales]MDO6591383.1 TetR family transcriptional regulator C-terminal domain-containing protein [Yoonia sp. 1_MG-2023]RBW43547.1 TetR/AcrR family transcriptional regulator [Loktanella sp. D2R18]
MNKPETRIQQRNRAAIMSAGLEVFSQYGLRGSTLDQIAEAAGLSKPNLLYYFRSKDAIYTALLEKLLETWLDPLLKLNPHGDPIQEILGYVHRKLTMSKDFPRESRLFANEILLGAPHIAEHLSKDLRTLVGEKAVVIKEWEAAGKIAPVDPYHLIFSIWSTTQHYADFDVQVRAVLGGIDPFGDAMNYLDTLFRRMLTPPKT